MCTSVVWGTYGQQVTSPRTGRPRAPAQRTHGGAAGGTCATVRKERENNRVVAMSTRVVFETAVAVAAALVGSTVSHAVNTCFVERHNGTARNRCRRKARKGYAFSKD